MLLILKKHTACLLCEDMNIPRHQSRSCKAKLALAKSAEINCSFKPRKRLMSQQHYVFVFVCMVHGLFFLVVWCACDIGSLSLPHICVAIGGWLFDFKIRYQSIIYILPQFLFVFSDVPSGRQKKRWCWFSLHMLHPMNKGSSVFEVKLIHKQAGDERK